MPRSPEPSGHPVTRESYFGPRPRTNGHPTTQRANAPFETELFSYKINLVIKEPIAILPNLSVENRSEPTHIISLLERKLSLSNRKILFIQDKLYIFVSFSLCLPVMTWSTI